MNSALRILKPFVARAGKNWYDAFRRDGAGKISTEVLDAVVRSETRPAVSPRATLFVGSSIMTCSVRACVLVMLLLFSGLLGCGNHVPPRVVPDLPDPSAAHKAMELYDTNHDGFLDAKELENVPGLKAALKQVDSNHDGKISEQEIADRIKSWADLRIGRTEVICQVTHNGKPLAGAKVVFVPEKFLGGTIQSGSGTTSANGQAHVSCPYAADSAVKGLAPAFYRVEVTKEGEKIPAKYNTETTLGAEVAGGRHAKESGGLFFDLQY